MEEKTLKTQDNTFLWTAVEGQGYPLILISGGPGCADYMGQVSSLINDSVQVIRFDPRGCGRSGNSMEYDLSVAISDIEDIRKEYNIEKWIVAGHSWGADLALAYTLKYSKYVKGLIYMSGTGIQNDIDWKEAYRKGKEDNLETVPLFEFPHNKEVNRSLLISWRKFIKTPRLLMEISKIETKALFISGSKDIRPSWPVEQVYHLVNNSKYEVLEGAGHYLWMTHGEKLEELIKGYLKEILE